MKHASLKLKHHPTAKHHHYVGTLFFLFFVSSKHRGDRWWPSGGASVVEPPSLPSERRTQCLPNKHLFFSSRQELNVINRIPRIQRRLKKVAIRSLWSAAAPERSRKAGLQKRDERVAGNPGFKGEQREVSEMQNNAISQGGKYESPCPENKEKHL